LNISSDSLNRLLAVGLLELLLGGVLGNAEKIVVVLFCHGSALRFLCRFAA
jgi:hypothetical protein